MDEYVSVLGVRTTDDNLYYTLNVNFLGAIIPNRVVFINCKTKKRESFNFIGVRSISQERVRAEHLLS